MGPREPVSVLAMTASHAKTDEPIEMPLGGRLK